jgi:cyclopropane-fatty-acyl-phospholipid synthase
MTLAPVLEEVLGGDLPVAIEAYDGSRAGPADPPATILIRSPDAIRRIVTSPGELGLARAFVSGDVDVDGDGWAVLALRERMGDVRFKATALLRLVEAVGGWRQIHRVVPPSIEAHMHGRLHTRSRDAAAISHHYDVSNAFYRMVLGPSLTYSCAVFHDPTDTLEQAQENKYELICRKLGLEPGMRLLDIGCGWGGMVLHAARNHGVEAVGVTISTRQAELAEKRAVEAGLSDQVEFRLQDYRDVLDGPYDAISSIGMFEHVGEARLAEYFERIHALLRPGGRLLNHGISRPAHRGSKPPISRRTFMGRYVFPDGELHEVGRVTSVIQEASFEVRHVESLREHYSLTLRRWVDNLRAHWDEAVEEVGEERARAWWLYMAGAAVNFDAGRTAIHQILAVPTNGDGRSGMPLRPSFT